MKIIILLFILVIFALLASNIVYIKTQDYKNILVETNKLKGNKKVDVVNTGSTFAYYGIDYTFSRHNGLNLALKPQSLKTDFAMLKKFSYRLNENAVVLIVVSDLAFAMEDYENPSSYNKYYKILRKKDIPHFSVIRLMQNKFLPVTLHWKNFFRFLKDVKPENDYTISVNQNDIEAVMADALHKSYAWCQEFELADLRDASQLGKFNDIFTATTHNIAEMIAWCKSKGYRPVLVNLPISQELEKMFSKDFLEEIYYKNINAANMENVPFIDFSRNKKLSDYYLYIDSARLNRSGREIITRLIDKKLEELGYYE